MSADNWTKCPRCGSDFREDYEVGVEDGTLSILYRGNCSVRHGGCDLSVKFTHEAAVDTSANAESGARP